MTQTSTVCGVGLESRRVKGDTTNSGSEWVRISESTTVTSSGRLRDRSDDVLEEGIHWLQIQWLQRSVRIQMALSALQ